MIITIGGNIGSGKSTVISKLNHRHTDVVMEPVTEWGPWLDLFYDDPANNAFGFQMKVLLEFSKIMSNKKKNCITERSPQDSLHVFAKTLLEQNQLTKDEYALFEDYVNTIAWKPDVYIYIHTPVDVCFDRINLRGRCCENTIDKSYLHHLDNNHNIMIEKNLFQKVYIVDGTRSKEKVIDDISNIINNTL